MFKQFNQETSVSFLYDTGAGCKNFFLLQILCNKELAG